MLREELSSIPMVNWALKKVEPELRLRLPVGNYAVSKYSLDGVAKCSLNGSTTFSVADLKSFSVAMKPHETAILVVKK